MEKLFDKSDDKIRRVVQNFLPALTTWDKELPRPMPVKWNPVFNPLKPWIQIAV